MSYRIFLAAFLFCCAFTVHAQNYPKPEISVTSSLDVFMDDFKTAYKPGSTHVLSLGVTDRHKKRRRAWGLNLGYGLYNPKGDTVNLDGGDFDEHLYYGKYRTLSVSGWGRWDYILSERFELFFGVELGYGFTSYDYVNAYGGSVHQEQIKNSPRLALAPQIGFGIPVNRFCFFAQSRYIFSFSAGDSIGVDGDLNRILSTGVGVRFRFERPYKKKDPEKPLSTKPKITYS